MERRPVAKMRTVLVDSRLGWSSYAPPPAVGPAVAPSEASPPQVPDPPWETALRLVGPELRFLLMDAIQEQTHAAWMIFKRRIESTGASIRMLGSRPLQYFVHRLRKRTAPPADERDLAYISYLITRHAVCVDDRILVDAAHVTRKQFPGLLFHLSKLSGRAIPAPIIKAMLAGPERQENVLEWIVECHVPPSWAHCESEHFEDVIRAILWSLNPGDDASWTADAVLERRNNATPRTMSRYQDWPRRMLRYRAWLASLSRHFPSWVPNNELLRQLWAFREPHKFLSPLFQFERIGNDDTCPRLLQLIEWTLQAPDDATWSFLVRQVGGQELAALLPPPAAPAVGQLPLPAARQLPPPAASPTHVPPLAVGLAPPQAVAGPPQVSWDPFYGKSLEWGLPNIFVAVQ